MKKLLIFFLFAVMIHEVRAVVPAIAVNNMREQRTLNKKRNAIQNNGFVLLNKEDKIEKLLEDKRIPKFYLYSLNSGQTVEYIVEYLRRKFKKKDVEILYIEVIPFYDEIKVFIIFDVKDKKETKIEEKKWYE